MRGNFLIRILEADEGESQLGSSRALVRPFRGFLFTGAGFTVVLRLAGQGLDIAEHTQAGGDRRVFFDVDGEIEEILIFAADLREEMSEGGSSKVEHYRFTIETLRR